MEVCFSQGPSPGALQSPSPPADIYPTTADFHQPLQLPAPLEQSFMLDQAQYGHLGSDPNVWKDKQAQRPCRTPSRKRKDGAKGGLLCGEAKEL